MSTESIVGLWECCVVSEAAAQADIREAAAWLGIVLFRNNSGAMTDPETGRLIRYGLGQDSAAVRKLYRSSDLIGWHEPSGRFVSIEVKRPGWLRPSGERELAQERWIQAVRRAGGIAGFATCVGDLHRIVDECVKSG